MQQTNEQQIPKARLVKGFKEPLKDEILKDSPTCSKEALCIVLSIIVPKNKILMQ